MLTCGPFSNRFPPQQFNANQNTGRHVQMVARLQGAPTPQGPKVFNQQVDLYVNLIDLFEWIEKKNVINKVKMITANTINAATEDNVMWRHFAVAFPALELVGLLASQMLAWLMLASLTPDSSVLRTFRVTSLDMKTDVIGA